MCYGPDKPPSRRQLAAPSQPLRRPLQQAEDAVEDLRVRLAETEARLARARAREAELSRRLEEMKRFVSVMEILETYLKRRFRQQRERVERLFTPAPRN